MKNNLLTFVINLSLCIMNLMQFDMGVYWCIYRCRRRNGWGCCMFFGLNVMLVFMKRFFLKIGETRLKFNEITGRFAKERKRELGRGSSDEVRPLKHPIHYQSIKRRDSKSIDSHSMSTHNYIDAPIHYQSQ
ncbi:hypothetical protein ACKWTF_012614 [Chironomus riparius]